ncbi:helix-turn-helix domain-containing protein [Mycobacteroides abscessus]|uniref:helix-turn-helix domain-containing protein n=1 Tax=Mycobacteroides abscessus TaxID=36809 RepID=UPI000C256FC6|nr:helix-turn-helix transcriptional regulator [Mycobacteroides abscessus]
MTAKLDYQWRLREVMAARGMFSTTDLRPMLAERGIVLSSSQVYRLVVDRPERLSMKVLMALIDILGCRMDELIEPIAVSDSRPKKRAAGIAASAELATGSGVGTYRPKRARITPPRTQ